jgi:hypothetical protein
LERCQQCAKPLHGRSLSPGQTASLEPADLQANESDDSRAKLRRGRCEQGAKASEVGAHMASRLDPLEQALVATGKPVEPRVRRPLVRIRCRSGEGIGCSGDGIGCSRATADRAGDGAGQIRADRGLRSDRRDCRGDRSDRIEKLGARHRGAANHPAQREYDEAQNSYGRRPHPTSRTPLWSGETRTRRGFGPSGIRRDFSSANVGRTRPARRRVLRLRRPVLEPSLWIRA